jgi:hypothetical protein
MSELKAKELILSVICIVPAWCFLDPLQKRVLGILLLQSMFFLLFLKVKLERKKKRKKGIS